MGQPFSWVCRWKLGQLLKQVTGRAVRVKDEMASGQTLDERSQSRTHCRHEADDTNAAAPMPLDLSALLLSRIRLTKMRSRGAGSTTVQTNTACSLRKDVHTAITTGGRVACSTHITDRYCFDQTSSRSRSVSVTRDNLDDFISSMTNPSLSRKAVYFRASAHNAFAFSFSRMRL